MKKRALGPIGQILEFVGVGKKPIQKPYRLTSAEKDKARGAEKRAIGPMGQKSKF